MTLQPNGTSTVMRNGDAMERPLSTLVAPIVGGIAGFGLLAILFFCFTRRRRRQRPKHGHGRGFDFLQEDDTTVAEEPMSSIAEKHQSGQSYSAIPPRPPPPRPLRFSESFPDAGDPFMDPVAYMHPSDPAEYMHPSDIPEQERPISLYSTHSSIVGGHDPDEQPLLIQDNGRALPGYTRLLPPRRDRRRSLQQQLAHSQSSLAWEDTPSVAEVEDMAEIDVSDTQSIQGQNQSPQNQNRLARGKGGGSKRYSPGG
ncbi:hypothetical protein BGW38_004928 [Lunasporangiospora selenospora]|uniref:Uncharacterized protein n=1 Tax=Lunasporangiospora selenospora TaxID=979761 RepID=A0A9P6FPI0_9FUNG|nr:hypothetical protein BGW38_004928 [Lunasporangiospora selenospora]